MMTKMSNAELLMHQLRNPPVMSMALNRDHLYSMMAESMSAAADRIEELQRENARLRAKLLDAELENGDLLMRINYE
jgi:hypothetical protein